MSDLMTFLAAARRNPRTVGAIAPSAPGLCRRIAEVVPRTRPATVVELGAGTGVVSDAIARRLQPGSRHLAIELDPHLAARLRTRRPGLEVVTGDATDLPAILDTHGIAQADAIICGLPWSLFPHQTQTRILYAVMSAMAPEAAFTTFAYVHALPLSGARALRRLLHHTFDEVIVGAPVWRNAPPALVYTCRRPAHAGQVRPWAPDPSDLSGQR